MLPRHPWLRRVFVSAVSVLALFPTLTYAFSVDVHRWLAERALRGVVQPGYIITPTEDQFVAFYIWLGKSMAMRSEDHQRDGDDPRRFMVRYPSPKAFDAFAIRGFLALAQEPTPAVFGLDEFDRANQVDRFNLVVSGAALPDIDKRNQNRFAYDASRKIVRQADGKPLPADPMILNMGNVDGLASQAHAHYQLAPDHPSDDPEVLKTAPWNFVKATAWPGEVQTSAADMAQMHLDLAILARAWGESEEESNAAAEYMSLVWWSAGLHYLQDAAGQLHTVQVGAYPMFVQAKMLWYRLGVLTGGGHWGELPTFVALAKQLIRNVHLFTEQWMAGELDRLRMGKPAAAALAGAWTQTSVDDPALLAALGDQLKPHLASKFQVQPIEVGAGQILVHTLAKLGAREGADLYAAGLRAMAAPLQDLRRKLGDNELLGAEDVASVDEAETWDALGEMATLHAKAMRRVTTATRLYWEALERGSPDAAARRLRRQRLAALDAQEQRLAQFKKMAMQVPAATEVVPEFLYGELAAGALAGAAVAAWVRRRKRRAVPA